MVHDIPRNVTPLSFSHHIGVANQFFFFVAFLQFSANELQTFLSEDSLNVNSEVQAFKALQKWINHNEVERLQNIKALISQIRLPLLPKQYLKENVMKQEILKTGGENLANKIFSVYKCLFMPYFSKNMFFRLHTTFQRCM